MAMTKRDKIGIWVLCLLLGGPVFLGCFVLVLQWIFSSRNTSEIIWKILIVLSALFLTISLSSFLISTIRRTIKASKRKYEKKIDLELGLKPIDQEELFTKYIDRRRFHFYLECKPIPWFFMQRNIFHGEYNGYEICIVEFLRGPVKYWGEGQFALFGSMFVHIKSSSFNFPKFLIGNMDNWRSEFTGEYCVIGNNDAQMLFARPHILNFFKQTHRFAVQGNGNEFMFFQINCRRDYRLLTENAFNVLKLLLNVETASQFPEIEMMTEKYKRDSKKDLLWLVVVGIIVALTVALIKWLSL